MNNKVIVFDTTLRDGEQSPGATMNLQEKLRLAKQLELLGVDVMEAGFPAASIGDFEAVQQIAQSVDSMQVAGLSRAFHGDIDRAWEAVKVANNPRIHTFIATSPIHMQYKLRKTPDQVVEMAVNGVRHAATYTSNVEFSAEDASRSDRDFLARVCTEVIKAGATTINLPDTVGYIQPHEYAELIKYVIEHTENAHKAVFSVHCHNDLGVAVANTLAALQVGVRQVEVTLTGLGERAGNAALEEVVMALRTRQDLYKLECNIKAEQIYPSCRLLSTILGRPIPPTKAIVGGNAFAHESGIHQDGMLKNRETYEIMTPESIGRSATDIVIGKHSGRAAVRSRLQSLGYQLDEEQLDTVFAAVKDLADKKATIHDEDLEALVFSEVYRLPLCYRLINISAQSAVGTMPATAAVVLEQHGKETRLAGFGVGTVDAVFNVLSDAVGRKPSLEQFAINAITGGTDALGEVLVRLVENNITAMGRAADPDVIVASAKAYVDALNRLYHKEQELQRESEK